jgi:hypothetical protein
MFNGFGRRTRHDRVKLEADMRAHVEKLVKP